MRFTCGTYGNGKKFTRFDHWRKHSNMQPLKRPWTGATVLFSGDCVDPDACASVICALHSQDVHMPQYKHVRLSDVPTVHEITPYSEMYDLHPNMIIATSTGWRRSPARADPFTVKSLRVMKARRIRARKRLGTKAAKED